MKKAFKLMAVDLFIVIIDILFFSSYDFSFSPQKLINFIITIFILFASGAIHCLAYQKLSGRDDNVMSKLNDILQNEETQIDSYMTQLLGIGKANPDYKEVIGVFVSQIESFDAKEKALMELISLNDGKSQSFLTSKNNDVKSYLVSNIKRFIKHLIAYGAKTKKNRSSRIEDEDDIRLIIENNNKLIDCYDSLLDEVAKMGDDFDIEDAGLQSVIENLQSLRIGSVEDDEDDQIHLYVSSGRK